MVDSSTTCDASDALRWHGRLACEDWALPSCVAESAEEARPGFSTCCADEFEDDPVVLIAKVRLFVGMLRQSSHTVAYTGAGISTAAGIKDYATKSQATRLEAVCPPRDELGKASMAKPTLAHHMLTRLQRTGLLAEWVQQNHDGLPQKAGFPQQHLNEIHGARFDPSNPVVHFRGKLRSDLFAWMLQQELLTELTVAVGTSLCDTPSTADRLVVSAAQRACQPESSAVGAVVVGLQRTRLDAEVQLRIYSVIDDFFALVAAELWGEDWQGRPEDRGFPLDVGQPAREALGDDPRSALQVGNLVYITEGPFQGRECHVVDTESDEGIHLDCGLELASWWLYAEPHPARFPLQMAPVVAERALAFQRVVKSVQSALYLPSEAAGPPLAFLPGLWQGEAVLSGKRLYHPTASEDRAQHLCLVMGSGDDGGVLGAGYTSWPAAHVMLGIRGRVWFTLRGSYHKAGADLSLTLEWEMKPGSRSFPAVGASLGPEQGECRRYRTQLNGRIQWDGRAGELRYAGTWQDEEGVGGAFALLRQSSDTDRSLRAGTWIGQRHGQEESWVFAVAPGIPVAFGAVLCAPSSESNDGLALLRGSFLRNRGPDGERFCLLERSLDERAETHLPVGLTNRAESVCLEAANLSVMLSERYHPMVVADLPGTYQHSAGGMVEVRVVRSEAMGADVLEIQNPRLQAAVCVDATSACIGGCARVHGQLGRLLREGSGIEWSNGSIWTRYQNNSAGGAQISAPRRSQSPGA